MLDELKSNALSWRLTRRDGVEKAVRCPRVLIELVFFASLERGSTSAGVGLSDPLMLLSWTWVYALDHRRTSRARRVVGEVSAMHASVLHPSQHCVLWVVWGQG